MIYEKPLFTLVLVILAFCSGCVSTTVVQQPSDSATLEEINALRDYENITVWAKDGQYWSDAQNLRVQPKTTYWFNTNGTTHQLATEDLDTITFHIRDGQSVLAGASAGLGFGVVLGGMASFGEQRAPGGWFTPLEAGLIVGVGVSLIAVPIGALVGWANGRDEVYRFEVERQEASIKSSSTEGTLR